MAHEELQKQYKKDTYQYGEDAYKLWEFKDYWRIDWESCWQEPSWHPHNEYRRKEPAFEPEYFSGLNWRDAEKLVGKVVEFSNTADQWVKRTLVEILDGVDNVYKYVSKDNFKSVYIRTTPQTYAHPTITFAGAELPRPEIEEPAICKNVWIWGMDGKVRNTAWTGVGTIWLEAGRVHLTESRAKAWADWWENTIMATIKGDKV